MNLSLNFLAQNFSNKKSISQLSPELEDNFKQVLQCGKDHEQLFSCLSCAFVIGGVFFSLILTLSQSCMKFSYFGWSRQISDPCYYLFSFLNCNFLFRSPLPLVLSWSTGLISVMTPSRPSGNIWKDNNLYSKVQPNARTTGILESSTL